MFQGVESFSRGDVTSGAHRVIRVVQVPPGWGQRQIGQNDFVYLPAVGFYRWEFLRGSALAVTNWYPVFVDKLLVGQPSTGSGVTRNFRLVSEPGVVLESDVFNI